MIRVIEQPDTKTSDRVRRFLSGDGVSNSACLEHDLRWLDVLRRSLAHRPYTLIAEDERGDVTGYLPLALVQSLMFGRLLVSLPYLNRAGVVATDETMRNALIARAVELADQLDVQYLELRHDHAVDHEAFTHRRDEKVQMLLDLPSDPEALWTQLSAKVRNQVRKGERNGLSIRWGGAELVDAFYNVFAVNMRDLGTPVYPRKLFRHILQTFTREAELAVVNYEGVTVAGALLLHDRLGATPTTLVPSASSLRAFSSTNANMWMYHQLLRRAIDRGSRRFDFGRCTPTDDPKQGGSYRFKKQWGATPHPSTWQYHLRHGELDAVRPTNPRYQKRIETWRKLPVWVTRVVGPAIVRGIP